MEDDGNATGIRRGGACAAAGLGRASFDVLTALRLADGEELSQRALVHRVGRTPVTMSARLGRLADRGLVARAVLTALLRRLALDLEGPADGGGRLGVAVAPAHVALRMSRRLASPSASACPCAASPRGGPAAAAGLDEGDLIVSVSGQEVRTVGDLQRAVARDDHVTLGVVRGTDERQVEVAPAAA